MKTKSKISVMILSLAIMIFSFSCEKPAQPDSQSAEDDAKGSLVVSDAFAFSNTAANSDGKSIQTDDCFIIAFTGIFPERVMTLTFDNCITNGITRNGQIVVTLGSVWNVGSTMTITFNQYTVNGISVEGTVVADYSLVTLIPTFTLSEQKMKLTFTDGKTSTWDSERVFTMNSGALTPLIRIDDIFLINGTKSGVNRYGEEYSSEYIEVESDKSCDWPKKGIVKVSKTGDDPTVIDFDQDGNAACDNIIKVSKNGFEFTISL